MKVELNQSCSSHAPVVVAYNERYSETPPFSRPRLGFDLVSENVCWFEMNGTELAFVDVTIV